MSTTFTFSFNPFELLTLLVVALLTFFFVFLCGLYVGKRVQERRSAQKGQAVRLPVVVAPEAETGAQKELDLTLLSELPALETKPSEALVSSLRPAADGHPLSEDEVAVSSRRTAVISERSLPSKSPPLSMPSQPLPAASSAVKPAGVQSMPVVELWSIQVEATRDKAAASALVRRLRAKGYEAYIVRVERQGEDSYRVWVGRFTSLAKASSAAARLRREEKVAQAFVVSE